MRGSNHGYGQRLFGNVLERHGDSEEQEERSALKETNGAKPRQRGVPLHLQRLWLSTGRHSGSVVRRKVTNTMGQATAGTREPWASPEDWEACRRWHRRFGTTYDFSSRLFPRELRQRVHALYAFVRIPDDWLDHPSPLKADVAGKLADYRVQTMAGFNGVRPNDPMLRAFLDVARSCQMTPTEPLLFLDAMESDLRVTRYPTYGDLEKYMRGSAGAVGLMLCDVIGVHRTASVTEGAMALAEAMQLTNFLRGVGEDLERGRIYLPLEDMDRFGVVEEDLYNRRCTEEFRELMRFEIRRARGLYASADRSISDLPKGMQRAVRLSRLLHSRILDRIEAANYDVFHRRARTSSTEKATTAFGVLVGRTTRR